MDRANGQSGSGAKKNQKVIIEQDEEAHRHDFSPARSATRKQSGRGANFSGVMSGIGDTCNQPFSAVIEFL